jgi:hypothetical protein
VAPLEGKIVLDANNYYPERDGNIGELDRDEITTSELLARHLSKSKVVKVFNAIQAAHIESDGRPAGSPDRRAHPIAGDDAAAKKVVADLLDQFGFDVVDAGPLAEGRRFQKGTPANCVPMDSRKLQEALAQSEGVMAGGPPHPSAALHRTMRKSDIRFAVSDGLPMTSSALRSNMFKITSVKRWICTPFRELRD